MRILHQMAAMRLYAGGERDDGYGRRVKVRYFPEDQGETDEEMGMATTVFSRYSRAHDGVIESRGNQGDRLVVAGLAGGPNRQMAMARFDAGGGLDRSFGTDGMTIMPFSGYSRSQVHHCLVDRGGKITLGGIARVTGENDQRVAMGRILENGFPDRSFHKMPLYGEGRFVDFLQFQPSNLTAMETQWGEFLLDPPRTIIGGYVTARDRITGQLNRICAVAAYDQAGFRVPDFGFLGLSWNDLGGHSFESINALAIDSKRRIIVATGRPERIYRLDPNGRLDQTFGDNGYVKIPPGLVTAVGMTGVTVGSGDEVYLSGIFEYRNGGDPLGALVVSQVMKVTVNGVLDFSFPTIFPNVVNQQILPGVFQFARDRGTGRMAMMYRHGDSRHWLWAVDSKGQQVIEPQVLPLNTVGKLIYQDDGTLLAVGSVRIVM